MAKTEKVDFNKLKLEELTQVLVDKKHDLYAAQKSLIDNSLTNPSRINKIRKDIARINTAINHKLINQAEEK